MDVSVSLEDIIQSRKLHSLPRGTGRRQPPIGRVHASQQRPPQQLRDARQCIAERKRQGISDARQLLLHRQGGGRDPVPLEVIESEPVGPLESLVPLLMPQKVIANDRYQPPPPPRIELEYAATASAAVASGRGRRGFYPHQQHQIPQRRRPAQPSLHHQYHHQQQQPPQLQQRHHFEGEYQTASDEFYNEDGDDIVGDEYADYADADDIIDDEAELYDYEVEAEPPPPRHYQQPSRYHSSRAGQPYEQLYPSYATPQLEDNDEEVAIIRRQRQHRPTAVPLSAVAAAPRSRPSRSASTLYGYTDDNGNYGYGDDIQMASERRRHRSRSPQAMSSTTSAAAIARAIAAASTAPPHPQPRPSQHQHQPTHRSLMASSMSTHAPASNSSAIAAAVAAASGPSSRHSANEVVKAYRVSISGLHAKVTRDDIYELFSSVGEVRKCSMLGDGNAEVVFPVLADAQNAVRRYDQRELDGVPMRLQLSAVGMRASGNYSAAAGAASKSSGGRHDRY